MKRFRSHGKLLLTAEYLVLDGATALALPTIHGQTLEIEEIDVPRIIWDSLDYHNEVWFQTTYQLSDFYNNSYKPITELEARLFNILNQSHKLNPMFLNNSNGFKVETKLEFPQNWGLGSSSTLINNVAAWAKVNPYVLLENTFGGSGYDVACASHDSPILFNLKEGVPNIKESTFNPPFKGKLYFVHLNKKQDSRRGIKDYRDNAKTIDNGLARMTVLTHKILRASSLVEFTNLIEEHEQLIAEITQQSPIKEQLFKDFNGSIKSLGAWGGDFILAIANDDPSDYFSSKGFNTILPYHKLILEKP